MLFLLNAIFGMYGIVWAQTAADSLTVILSFYMLHHYRPLLRQRTTGALASEG